MYKLMQFETEENFNDFLDGREFDMEDSKSPRFPGSFAVEEYSYAVYAYHVTGDDGEPTTYLTNVVEMEKVMVLNERGWNTLLDETGSSHIISASVKPEKYPAMVAVHMGDGFCGTNRVTLTTYEYPGVVEGVAVDAVYPATSELVSA